MKSLSYSHGVMDVFARAALMCMAPLLTVPFLLSWRSGLVPGWFLESIALGLALFIVALSALGGCLKSWPPLFSMVLGALAAFVWAQARWLDVPFPGQNSLLSVILTAMALLVWAAQGLNSRFGRDEVAQGVAWSLVCGAILQSAVCAIQFLGYADKTYGIILSLGNTDMSGQVGQRNHLGHYMLWGVMGMCYLYGVRQVRTWLALPVLVWLLAIVGLIASRTILTYTIAIGVIMLCWYGRNGLRASRIFAVTFGVMLLVVAAQKGMPLLMQHWGFVANSGFERVSSGSNSHGASSLLTDNPFLAKTIGMLIDDARQLEWKKAWLAIQAHPWRGYGWGGQPLQSFLYDYQFDLFTTHHSTVLFTHNHNLILQLWLELGGVATLLLGLGFVATVLTAFRQPLHASAVFYVCLIAISLCHSMLEYPLWYVYFLAPFMLFVGLIRAPEHARTHHFMWPGVAVAVISLWGVAQIVQYASLYQKLNDWASSASKEDSSTQLLNLAREHQFLDYAAYMALIGKIDVKATPVQPWAADVARRVAQYRPYASHAPIWGLIQYRTGDTAKAQDWLEKTWHYYPVYLPQYVTQIHESPLFKGLYAPALKACQNYHARRPEMGSCTADDEILETN